MPMYVCVYARVSWPPVCWCLCVCMLACFGYRWKEKILSALTPHLSPGGGN